MHGDKFNGYAMDEQTPSAGDAHGGLNAPIVGPFCEGGAGGNGNAEVHAPMQEPNDERYD